MSLSLQYVFGEMKDFIFNPDYRHKALVQSNVLTPSICLCYYLFVSYIGPKLMRSRQPFKLKYTILFYNAFLVALNIVGFYGFTISFIKFRGNLLCPEDPKARYAELADAVRPYTWLYVMLKYVELLDSIFFLMRKRFDLLSVLHRVHHGTLPVLNLVFMRYSENLCMFIGMVINTAIHIIMYSYYGLASAGPQFRKYLWWKKYLTSIQIFQMLANIGCVFTNTFTGCYPTKISEILFLSMCGLFFVLFVNYFVHQWIKANPKAKEKEI